mgnify:CR=1 FL=1
MFFFFFKQKTAYEIRNCDWSSDVCSSDLFFVAKSCRRKDGGPAPRPADSPRSLSGKVNGGRYATLDDGGGRYRRAYVPGAGLGRGDAGFGLADRKSVV